MNVSQSPDDLGSVRTSASPIRTDPAWSQSLVSLVLERIATPPGCGSDVDRSVFRPVSRDGKWNGDLAAKVVQLFGADGMFRLRMA